MTSPQTTILTLLFSSVLLTSCDLQRNSRVTSNLQKADQQKADQKKTVQRMQAKKHAADAAARKSSAIESNGLTWRGLAFPTGDERTSAVVLRKGVPAQVQLNREFDYHLEVRNLTDHNLEDVVVSDQLPKNFKLKSSTPAPHATVKGKAEWVFAKLAPKQSKTIRITGTASSLGTLNSCASVSYDTRVCSSIRVVQPAIELIKSTPAVHLICDTIPVRYVIRNTGSGTARNIRIDETLSANIMTANRRPIHFTVDELKPGSSREFKLDLKAAKAGTFHGVATAVADGGLSAKSNVSKILVRQPAVKAVASAPKNVLLGRDLTFLIAASNVGDCDAEKAVIEATIPTGARFLRANHGGKVSGRKVVWQIGSIAERTDRKVSFTVRPTTPGKMMTSALVRGHCINSAIAMAETQVTGIPAIMLEVIDVEDPIPVGAEETYEIRVTNQGTAPATNIEIQCVLEDSMKFLRATGITRGAAREGTVKFLPLKSLAPKKKATWRVVVKAMKPADARFTVRLTGDQYKRSIDETEATNFYK